MKHQFSSSSSFFFSRSVWEEFFHSANNDKYFLSVSDIRRVPLIYVENPIFIIPMITFHPGHILIDLLEQLFSFMRDLGADMHPDCIIVLDVASAYERSLLHDITKKMTADGRFLASTINFFSNHSITSSEFARKTRSCNCVFKNIYVGVDLIYSSYYHGYRFPQSTFVSLSRSSYFSWLSKRFENFSSYLRQLTLSHQSENGDEIIDVLFINRRDNRCIDNILDLELEVEKLGWHSKTRDLSQLDLTEQLGIFKNSKLIAAAGGTALHNVIWFQSHIILFMPPNWCDFSWLYRNAATLRGLNVSVICAPRLTQVADWSFFQWSRKSWLQPPRLTKHSNFSVSAENFARSLKQFTASQEDQGTNFRWQNSCKETLFGSPTRTLIDKVQVQNQPNGWNLIIEGNLYGKSSSVAGMLKSSPFAAVCMRSFLDTGNPWCSELSTMNYYSTLNIFMNKSSEVLHFWVQAFSTGAKFKGSDIILPVDCSLQNCGYTNTHKLIESDTMIDLTEILDGDSLLQSESPRMINLREDLSLQDGWTEFGFNFLFDTCKSFHLTINYCERIAFKLFYRLQNQSLLKRRQLPPIQYVPTPNNPFVFLHVDKCGGTTIREVVARSGKKLGLNFFVPCYNDISCFTFDITENQELINTPIISGHFQWDIWKKLHQCKNFNCQPRCLVVGRSPIDRVLSYYHQRFFKEWQSNYFNKSFNELNVDDWRRLIVEHRFARWKEDNETVIVVDEGMSDPMCRTVLGKRISTGVENPRYLPLPTRLNEEEIKKAIENSKSCIVGITERWDDTVKVIRSWFPWIEIVKEVQLNAGEKSYRDFKPREDLIEVIREYNQCDIRLYSEMLRQFRNQLSLLDQFV